MITIKDYLLIKYKMKDNEVSKYRPFTFCSLKWKLLLGIIVDVSFILTNDLLAAAFTCFNAKRKKHRLIVININNLWSYLTFLIVH